MNNRKQFFLAAMVCLICLGCFSPLAFAQAADEKKPEPTAKEKEWTPEDVVMQEQAGQFRVAPDGKWAVWVKTTADKEKDARVSNVFLTSLTEKKEIQLTRGTESHMMPRWSPNGEIISFLSTRSLPKPNPDLSRAQLWLINANGGEPWHLTEFKRGLRSYEWIDSDTIIFSAEEDPTLYETEVKKKKDATQVVDDIQHTPPVRLFKLTVKEKKVTRLTENDDWIESWTVSPDGKWAATVHAQYLSYEWDHKIPPKTFLYDLTTGKAKQVTTDERFRPAFVRWAKDNSGFYAVAPHTTHPKFFTASILLLYFYDVASGQLQKVDLNWERGLAFFGFEPTKDGFLALLADGVRPQFARYTRSGSAWTRTNIEGEHAKNVFSFSIGEDGKSLVYEYTTASTPQQWYRATLEGNRITGPVQITDVNEPLKKKNIAKTEVVRWKGANGEENEGILYYPHNYEPGKKYALFTAPHGGPAGADYDAWDESYAYAQQLLNQGGAFVFKPNYHGSSDYGLAWVESICCGKYYDLPVADIESGVDYLIARGLVDPERIGTFGWSNGSILSIAVSIHNPDRYKVVGAGAGDVEWISDWANVDFGQAFDAYYVGKSPLEDPQLYIQISPLFKMDRVKAPTIIFFGTEDRNVPTSQGWTHYRALYHLGKVPVRFLLFPGEPHGLRKLTHQLRKLEEEMAWFDRYFFRTEKPANLAFQEDSPLGMALRRKSIAKVGTRFGSAFKPAQPARGHAVPETLIPEVVKRGEIEVGRFEVTRAQWAAFDPAYKFEPGTENYPATGVTFEKAKEYAAWLSKLTGQTWRIANEDEVASLYESREGQNTLDYWAGYSPNPDDAERLAAKSKELDGATPLLKEVGSFRGAGKEGEELIFDLGGNVAEWVIAKDGSGKLTGGSADRAADAKARANPAAPEYTGLRVVRGAPKK
jgi:dipeptidyl aminopeptidase/acylaminoacyl peptidase